MRNIWTKRLRSTPTNNHIHLSLFLILVCFFVFFYSYIMSLGISCAYIYAFTHPPSEWSRDDFVSAFHCHFVLELRHTGWHEVSHERLLHHTLWILWCSRPSTSKPRSALKKKTKTNFTVLNEKKSRCDDIVAFTFAFLRTSCWLVDKCNQRRWWNDRWNCIKRHSWNQQQGL